MAEDNVAVLIDFENTGLDSVQYLLDQLSDVGRVIIKRAYADWSVERNRRDQLLELGVEAKHLFRSTKSGKNSSDILLTIDAVELLFGTPVDTFVIVSSDSDFVPLVSRLRAAGKGVIGAGRREAASPTLVKSCDRYIYLDDARPPSDTPTRERSRGPQDRPLVVRALEASMDDQGQVLGSKLFQTMQRIDPSFSFRALGHSSFAQFLQSSKEVSVTRRTDTSDMIVQLDHPRERGEEAPNGATLSPTGTGISMPHGRSGSFGGYPARPQQPTQPRCLAYPIWGHRDFHRWTSCFRPARICEPAGDGKETPYSSSRASDWLCRA